MKLEIDSNAWLVYGGLSVANSSCPQALRLVTDFNAMQDENAELKRVLTEAEELKEAVEYCKIHRLDIRIIQGHYNCMVCPAGSSGLEKNNGSGNSFPAAVTDYREKNPVVEPETEEPSELAAYIEALKAIGSGQIYRHCQSNSIPVSIYGESGKQIVQAIANHVLAKYKVKPQPDRLEGAMSDITKAMFQKCWISIRGEQAELSACIDALLSDNSALKEEVERLREALGSIEVGTEDSSDAALTLISINSIARYALKYATPPDKKVTSPDSEPSRPVQQEKEEGNNV